ncbi:hypothetical protein ABPG74_020261 [Tetrahymena malaccensis]
MQSQDHLEKENNVKQDKEEEDQSDDSDERYSEDDIDYPLDLFRVCMETNCTDGVKILLAQNPNFDFRYGRGQYIIQAIKDNNAELLQLYIDRLQKNYINKKQKESQIAGHLARFKLRKYLQNGLDEADGYDLNLDDVLVVIKKYIPIDYKELDRSQDILNDFPNDMKSLPDLNN